MSQSGAFAHLKRLTYRPELITAARWLGLRGLLRRWYYRWARPADGILHIQLAGIGADFFVHTPEELRILDKAQSKHWEYEILEALINKLSDGGVVYDIGSNIGLYTLFLAKAVDGKGQVIAFEPEGKTHGRLRKNLELNAIENVRTFQVALGDYNGEAKLYFSDEDSLFASLVRPRHENMTYQVVQVLEGDRLRETANVPCPRVVKIDVEGFEYGVMRGLRATLSDPRCELISCEVHPTLLPQEVKEELVLKLIESFGFVHMDVRRSAGIPEYHVLASKA